MIDEQGTISGLVISVIILLLLFFLQVSQNQDHKAEIESLKMENHYLQTIPSWMLKSYSECLNETDTASGLRVCVASKIMISK